MSRRDNQIIAYLTDQEKAQLNEYVGNSEKTQSEVVRRAIMEYLDRDRAARLESEVRDLHEKVDRVVDTLDSDNSHTHTEQPSMNQGSTAVERARDMVQRLQQNHEPVIKNDDVERAIEDIAGADNRTIRKYKQLFRKRGLLFEHPGERPVWTVESEKWCEWIADYGRLNGKDDAEKKAQEYPATVTLGMNDKLQVELTEVER